MAGLSNSPDRTGQLSSHIVADSTVSSIVPGKACKYYVVPECIQTNSALLIPPLPFILRALSNKAEQIYHINNSLILPFLYLPNHWFSNIFIIQTYVGIY